MPGLRLGLLACSNPQVITYIKQALPIWNINSFGEYFLQIFEKYKTDYAEALEQFRHTRTTFCQDLSAIRQLSVYPSQANFLMCEITDGGRAPQIAELLLNRYNILVKDLSGKSGMGNREFLRIAIRTEEENACLVNALKHILR